MLLPVSSVLQKTSISLIGIMSGEQTQNLKVLGVEQAVKPS